MTRADAVAARVPAASRSRCGTRTSGTPIAQRAAARMLACRPCGPRCGDGGKPGRRDPGAGESGLDRRRDFARCGALAAADARHDHGCPHGLVQAHQRHRTAPVARRFCRRPAPRGSRRGAGDRRAERAACRGDEQRLGPRSSRASWTTRRPPAPIAATAASKRAAPAPPPTKTASGRGSPASAAGALPSTMSRAGNSKAAARRRMRVARSGSAPRSRRRAGLGRRASIRWRRSPRRRRCPTAIRRAGAPAPRALRREFRAW